ncbi:hypothetical protein MRB53_040754 [Persea americana]|nr:hypothetical protein MRB53_040754 [Persea americana]
MSTLILGHLNIANGSTPTDAQVKQASLDHAPFQAEEAWVEQVAEAHSNGIATTGSDPTVANAGLTELAPDLR